MKSRIVWKRAMSKRKLTRRQAWRIEKVQSEYLDRISRHKVRVESLLEDCRLNPEKNGRVVAQFGKQVEIVPVNSQGQPNGNAILCHVRANITSLVTGDAVIYQTIENTGIVTACHTRKNVLERPDSKGDVKAMAANIDQLVIVTAPEPAFHPELVDRYLVATEVSNIKPLIVINKGDLMNDSDVITKYLLTEKKLYESLGYLVVGTTIKEADGLTELSNHLMNKSSVFIGQSGVGKSSLVQALLPSENIRVGHLHKQTRLGRHITSTARLFPFKGGGSIIDSPGVRNFGLGQISRSDLDFGFIDIRKFAVNCRFRDCRHRYESGCAVLDAAQQGRLSKRRLESFQRILDTLNGGNA